MGLGKGMDGVGKRHGWGWEKAWMGLGKGMGEVRGKSRKSRILVV